MVHSEMCANWGYEKLHKYFEKRAIDEMKHAEKLIGRILFLEGTPIVNKLGRMSIGADASKQLASDHALELGAIQAYNQAIKLAGKSTILPHGRYWKTFSRMRTRISTDRGVAGPDSPHDASLFLTRKSDRKSGKGFRGYDPPP